MSTGDAPSSGQRSVSSSVEVSVDPASAFVAFTDELDFWWVRGPINHHAAGRVAAMRCEPGVGGRLLEVYDDRTGDALQLGLITAWEPGERLAWTSSIDDVNTEVRFQASPGGGTLVQVVATISDGGADRGGTAWVRVVPNWLPLWCGERDRRPHEVRDLARLALAISYAKPASAARWLAHTFGFESPGPLPAGDDPLVEGEHGHPWIEFRLGRSSLMIFPRAASPSGDHPVPLPTHVPWVYVDDIVTHHQRAQAAGATIVRSLASPWGLPMYVAADPEGNHWTFAQARPTMDQWGSGAK